MCGVRHCHDITWVGLCTAEVAVNLGQESVRVHHSQVSQTHALVEIRHDLIRDPAGQEEMAALLSAAIRDLLEISC